MQISELLNENIQNFSSIGMPPHLAQQMLRQFNVNHDAPIEPTDKPSAADLKDGGIIVNILPNGNAIVLGAVYRNGEYNFRRIDTLSGDTEVQYFQSASQGTKGMSKRGKFYKVKGDVQHRDDHDQADRRQEIDKLNDPLKGGTDNIYVYMDKAFFKRMKPQLDSMVDSIYMNLRKLDKNKTAYGDRLQSYSKNQQEEALKAAQAIEQIAEKGFNRETMENFLQSIGKLHAGFGSVPSNQRELEKTLTNDPLSRAKWAKTIMDVAKMYKNNVDKMIAMNQKQA